MNFSERIAHFQGSQPNVHPTAFVAAGATVVGDVTIGEESSIWFHATVRGDINFISIGRRSNIQDGAVVHVADVYGATIGDRVTVGHNAIVHACTIGDEVLVGMGAIVLDGAEIGSRCIIGAGALITGGKKIPSGSLVLGSPAQVVRTLSPEEQDSVQEWAERYVVLSRTYLQQIKSFG